MYGGINRTNRRRELDRRTWAESSLFVFPVDAADSPTSQVFLIDFLTVFEGQPIFRWGVELRPESKALVSGSYPYMNAGVGLWTETGPEPPEGGVTLYSGATVWVRFGNASGYLYTFRFGFEGTVFKNVSTLR